MPGTRPGMTNFEARSIGFIFQPVSEDKSSLAKQFALDRFPNGPMIAACRRPVLSELANHDRID
jgi:hypothetical protein